MAVHHKSEVDPNTGSLPTGSAKSIESEVMCDQVKNLWVLQNISEILINRDDYF